MTWNKREKKKNWCIFSFVAHVSVWACMSGFFGWEIAEATESEIVKSKIHNNSKKKKLSLAHPHICIALSKSYYYKYCYKTKNERAKNPENKTVEQRSVWCERVHERLFHCQMKWYLCLNFFFSICLSRSIHLYSLRFLCSFYSSIDTHTPSKRETEYFKYKYRHMHTHIVPCTHTRV